MQMTQILSFSIALVVLAGLAGIVLAAYRKLWTKSDAEKREGEAIIKSSACTLRKEPSRSLEVGRLYVTARRLVWVPAGFPLFSGSQSVEIPLDTIHACILSDERDGLKRPVVILSNIGAFKLYFGDFLIGAPRKQDEWIRLIESLRRSPSV